MRNIPLRVPGRHEENAPQRLCERCETPFTVPKTAPHKRFCSERCQRAAERERYRRRRTDQANCKRCGEPFERTTTTKRQQVYCSLRCQHIGRQESYRQRADIQAGIRRAAQSRHPGGNPESPSQRTVEWGPRTVYALQTPRRGRRDEPGLRLRSHERPTPTAPRLRSFLRAPDTPRFRRGRRHLDW